MHVPVRFDDSDENETQVRLLVRALKLGVTGDVDWDGGCGEGWATTTQLYRHRYGYP